MPELWYAIVAFLLTAYTVMDGYDLGAGALAPWVARTDAERRQVLAAIGPYWDGNEVWLLAAGGALFVGFPRVLSGGISGFYFAIFLVLWCLIIRGISIEFRSHVPNPLWRGAWDFFFVVASVLLPVFFGAALGNLLRGVPLTPEGWFELPLFTNFTAADPVGILDWYTIVTGVFALVALLAHGSVFLAWKTSGEVGLRSRAAGRRLFPLVAVLWAGITLATASVNPDFFKAVETRPLAWLLALAALAGLISTFSALRKGRDLAAFLGSCAFLGGLSLATAVCAYPVLLRARAGPALSMTVANSAGDPEGLKTASTWFAIGFPLVIAYFTILFRLHRGKAACAADGEGY
jgi:cytochrome d ubiquinol oxidase subunit II